MVLDPITLEVLNNRLRETVLAMEYLLFHSGYSTILRESFDGSAAICDRDGYLILRYRLERAMLAGDLLPRDLPGAWTEGLRKLIGVTPRSDREGCLQDIHWYDGAWGYFPTYTLGALIAAQFFAALRQALPDIADRIGRGEFAPVFEWLRAHIHGKGSLYTKIASKISGITIP